ncbi:MAG: endonuclease III [Candidatus Bathyarchaeota archaeon]
MSERAEEIISRLLSGYGSYQIPRSLDPFSVLVNTILSQNTNSRNRSTAYRNLEEAIGITPEALSQAPLEDLVEAIRPAGMYNQRSRVLKEVSRKILERFSGSLDQVMLQPYPEARERLMSLPGVGPKTADIVLMFVAERYIVPVDRHIFRISQRLEIVSERPSYDEVRRALEEASPPEKRKRLHLSLIQFGREICKARKPLCRDCSLEDLCDYPEKMM